MNAIRRVCGIIIHFYLLPEKLILPLLPDDGIHVGVQEASDQHRLSLHNMIYVKGSVGIL